MTISYEFASNEDGWALSNTTWEASLGNSPGCLKETILPGCEADSPAISDDIVSDGSMKFHYRFINCGDCNPLFDTVDILLTGGLTDQLPITATADSGWLLYTWNLAAHSGATITGITINTTSSSTPSAGYVLIDNVYLGTITGGPADPAGLNYALTHSSGGIPGGVMI